MPLYLTRWVGRRAGPVLSLPTKYQSQPARSPSSTYSWATPSATIVMPILLMLYAVCPAIPRELRPRVGSGERTAQSNMELVTQYRSQSARQTSGPSKCTTKLRGTSSYPSCASGLVGLARTIVVGPRLRGNTLPNVHRSYPPHPGATTSSSATRHRSSSTTSSTTSNTTPRLCGNTLPKVVLG